RPPRRVLRAGPVAGEDERLDRADRPAPAPDRRQRQLTRTGNAATGAGLALLMGGRDDEARLWLSRAAERYRESWEDAPVGSWGRPIGAIKALVLAGDRAGAEDAARWALEADAAGAESPIGGYAATLALLVLERDEEAHAIAATLQGRDDFPADVADALVAIATGERAAFAAAAAGVLDSFEAREEYLEDVPVADTVLVLQALARERGLAAELRRSALLPDRE
ncbi:MAG TPA: hypothetical protein VH416_07025, partial [Gaiellaceae bacterium]